MIEHGLHLRQLARHRAPFGLDALGQVQGALGAAQEREQGTAIFAGQLVGQQTALAQLPEGFHGLNVHRRPGSYRRDCVAQMGGKAAVHHGQDRLHDLQPLRGEGLALDPPGDLVQRFAQAGAEVFFLDQAGHQFGLLGRQLGPKGGGRETGASRD